MKKNKAKVGKVRFEPKALGIESVAHNHHTIRSTQLEWQTDSFTWVASGQAYPQFLTFTRPKNPNLFSK